MSHWTSSNTQLNFLCYLYTRCTWGGGRYWGKIDKFFLDLCVAHLSLKSTTLGKHQQHLKKVARLTFNFNILVETNHYITYPFLLWVFLYKLHHDITRLILHMRSGPLFSSLHRSTKPTLSHYLLDFKVTRVLAFFLVVVWVGTFILDPTSHCPFTCFLFFKTTKII